MELDRGITPDKPARYFEPVDNRWRVRDELRATATFRQANLLEPISGVVPFDVIFCYWVNRVHYRPVP
jgi:chemotaxis protein methyltransferase CheR